MHRNAGIFVVIVYVASTCIAENPSSLQHSVGFLGFAMALIELFCCFLLNRIIKIARDYRKNGPFRDVKKSTNVASHRFQEQRYSKRMKRRFNRVLPLMGRVCLRHMGLTFERRIWAKRKWTHRLTRYLHACVAETLRKRFTLEGTFVFKCARFV